MVDGEVEEVPVLVVGGSLVGLSAAVFLAHHGVPPLVVERHPGTAIHPRAGHFHLRTLELLRSVGLEPAVRRLSAERYFPNGGINQVETLAGGETASYIADLNAGVEAVSPSRRLFVAQDALEPLLRERALELGATLSYATAATVLEADDTGVTVALEPTAGGETRTVRAAHVVAADGWRSPIRERLGIALDGYGLLSRSATIYFHADCEDLLRDANQGVIYVANDRLRGFFRFERSGTSGFLAVNTLGDPRAPGALDVTGELTPDGARELVRAAIGVADLDVRVDDVAQWDATAAVAERYRDGRILLAGDAVHPLPPNGGFGGNTGVQDAHNLAWKLALVVRGEAGERLLETYDDERRPIGRMTIEQAYARYMRRVTPELAGDDVPDLVEDLRLEIGYRYRSAAVVPEAPEDDDGELTADPRTPDARPGGRAPHVALRGDDGRDRSTLDLLGDGFVLLAASGGGAWVAAAAAAGASCGIAVAAHRIDDDDFAERYGLSAAGAVLVRPDGVVGWRSRNGAPGGQGGPTLTRALRTVLCLSP